MESEKELTKIKENNKKIEGEEIVEEEGFCLRKTIYLRSRSMKKKLQTIVEEEIAMKKDSEWTASEHETQA